MKINARNAAGSSCGQQTTQGACVSNRAVEDRGRRLNQSHLRPMAEISFLPSANTRKRASACREQWTWTFLVSKRSASVKYTTVVGVKLRLFRVYIESLTISSQEPGKKKSKRDNGLFCLYSECTCVGVMYFVPGHTSPYHMEKHKTYNGPEPWIRVFLQERMRNR